MLAAGRLAPHEPNVLTPIRRYPMLSLLWRHSAFAYLSMQPALNPVFVIGVVRADMALGPEVLRVFAVATDFNCDEMVFLIVAWIRVGVAILANLLDLKSADVGRGGPVLLRGSPMANGLDVCRPHRAWGARAVGQASFAMAYLRSVHP